MTTPYALTERKLSAALRNFTPGSLSVKDAATRYNVARVANGLNPTGTVDGFWLLTAPGNNVKLEKGKGLPNASLALAPHTLGGIDVCPSAGSCAAVCVAFAGNGGFPAVTAARVGRKAFMVSDPEAFATLLVRDLDKLAATYPDGFAVRLNSFSDLRWERILGGWFWERYASVHFYDYTKWTLRGRPVASMPANYVLTYSQSERTRKGESVRNLHAGRNVAVVVGIRGGKHRTTGEWRPIEPTFDGFPVIDGDEDDRRYADKPGHVVVLRRKGSLNVGSDFLATNLK
jgi:hypothetical protein